LDLPLSSCSARSPVLLAVWWSAARYETPLDFERLGFLSTAQALQCCRDLEQVDGWGLRKSFPLSWLGFHILEGLLLLPVLCSCLPEPMRGWFG